MQYTILFAILVVILSICLLWPSTTPLHHARGNRIGAPGPIVTASINAISLDGLTLIPVAKLLPLEFTFTLPYTTWSLTLSIRSTVSELVFKKLEISAVNLGSFDLCREQIHVKVSGVCATFTGSFGTRAMISVGRNLAGTHGRTIHWAGQFRSSGRIAATLEGSSFALQVRLVQPSTESPSVPRLEAISSSLDQGQLLAVQFDGFNNFGSILTLILPYLVGTSLWNWHRDKVTNHVTRKTLEGKGMDQEIYKLFNSTKLHLDLSSYKGLGNDTRDTAMASFISDTQTVPLDLKKRPFTFSCHLVGPTLLKSFLLADSSPILYRPGGAREMLQCFNLLTEQVRLELKETELRTISFDRSSIVFDSATAVLYGGGGELVVNVMNVEAELHSKFKLYAKTKGLTSWTTGVKKIGEKGASKTIIKTRVLRLKFLLIPSPAGSTTPYTLASTSLSPFNSINTSFTLSNLKFGAELLNSITSSLEKEIAAAVSQVLRRFFRDSVRKNLQEVLEEAENKLREVGVELPIFLRGR